MRPPMVLCLGNEILCDDAFGPMVANHLSARPAEFAGVEIVSAPVAGFALLDLLRDRPEVLVIDAIITGHAKPGTLHIFEAGELAPSYTLTNSHQISLPTAIELGRQLGLVMPNRITVLAVEALDISTLTECLTPPVAEAIGPAIRYIYQWIVSVQPAVPVAK